MFDFSRVYFITSVKVSGKSSLTIIDDINKAF